MTEIPLKGNIREFPLPRVLIYLNRNRKTGTLIVSTHAFTKMVYIDKGDAIFASSTYEDDRLGEMLIKAGKITLEHYEESVKLLKTTNKRQGAILVELGYLTPKDLFWGVKYQVREIICSLFPLDIAEYKFLEGKIPANEVITLKMSTGNLIYEGVRRVNNINKIKKELPDLDSVLQLSTDPASLFQDIEFSTRDKTMFSMIDGEKTIKELLEGSSAGSFEALKTLYALWSTGTIEEKERIMEKAEETVPVEEILKPISEERVQKEEVSPSQNAEELFKRGVEEFKKGNFRGAADSFKGAVKLNEKNVRCWSYLSLAYIKMDNRLKDAEEALFQAIKLEPLNPDHYANLGHIYLKAGIKKKAQIQFEKTLTIDPDNAKAKKGLQQTGA
jgi:tetratricopeptide (TPR) repeat protein